MIIFYLLLAVAMYEDILTEETGYPKEPKEGE